MFAYCNNNPVIFVDPLGYEGLVGFGIQFDVSTEHGTYGVEIVVYLDPEVVANTTNSDEEVMAISLYTYSRVSISLKEIVIAPQIVEMASQLDLEKLNNMPEDEILITLGALLSEYDISGSLFLIYGYDNFTSADSYSGSFSTWTFS